MAAADNLRRLFDEGINQRNMMVLDDLLDERFITHGNRTDATGPEAFLQILKDFLAGFPDLHVTLHDVIEDGNTAAARGTWTGTHQGEFMGIPPTGRSVSVSYIDIWHSEGGMFTENWVQMDILGLMQQLGVAPTPEATSV